MCSNIIVSENMMCKILCKCYKMLKNVSCDIKTTPGALGWGGGGWGGGWLPLNFAPDGICSTVIMTCKHNCWDMNLGYKFGFLFLFLVANKIQKIKCECDLQGTARNLGSL